MLGIRTAKFINVLIIVTHGDDTHIIIGLDQRLHQRKLMLVHILRFIDDQNALHNSTGFNFAILDHFSRIFYNVFNTFQTANLSKKIKAI